MRKLLIALLAAGAVTGLGCVSASAAPASGAAIAPAVQADSLVQNVYYHYRYHGWHHGYGWHHRGWGWHHRRYWHHRHYW